MQTGLEARLAERRQIDGIWQAAWAQVDTINLEGVAMRLALEAPEGQAWSKNQIKVGLHWYRRFLKLCAKYPELPLVPNGPIDEVWHTHVLDTRAYDVACQAIFGEFLHHYPYFGLRDDARERDLAFDATNELYRREFGEDCREMKAHFDASSAGSGVRCNDGGSTGCGQRCSNSDISS